MSDPRVAAPDRAVPPEPAPGRQAYDPLRLCVYATVALLTWLLGPVALLGFAVLGAVGYARARRAGLLRSRCLLGDTRLVLAYLLGVALLAAVALARGWWSPLEGLLP